MNFVAPHPDERLASSTGNFGDLNPGYKDILSDGAQKSQFLTVSYLGVGKNFIVGSTGSVDFKGTNIAKPKPVTCSELNLLTNIAGRDVEARFDSNGLIRLWANFGTLVSPNLRNISAKLKTNTSFQKPTYSLNFGWTYKTLDLSTQVHVRDNSHPFLSQKLSWNKTMNQDSHLQVDAVCKLSLATLLFSRFNFWGSYSHKNYVLWAGSKWSAADSNKAILAALYQAEKFDSVVKVSLSKTQKDNLKAKVTVGTVFQLDEKTTLRARQNSEGDLRVGVTHVVNNNLAVSVGSQVNVTEPSSFSTTTVVPVPIGISLNFMYA